MSKKVLFVLGGPNGPDGKLSKISKSRLDSCLGLYEPGDMVLCTGGWGKHFNTSKEAHAVYAQRYLLSHGLPGNCFMPHALSENTVDDAVKILPVLARVGSMNLTVITSDYHLERVKMIFGEILSGYRIQYVGVPFPHSEQELKPLIDHEQRAIAMIRRNGLYY
jgi:uncharacterized SAM-binding protein YcdF (DUF218 family)